MIWRIGFIVLVAVVSTSGYAQETPDWIQKQHVWSDCVSEHATELAPQSSEPASVIVRDAYGSCWDMLIDAMGALPGSPAKDDGDIERISRDVQDKREDRFIAEVLTVRQLAAGQ